VKNAVVLIETIKFRMVAQSETIPTPLGSSSEGSGHSAVKPGNRPVTSKEPLQQWGVVALPQICHENAEPHQMLKSAGNSSGGRFLARLLEKF
jgi:hypothetical protein